jgi:hypothetical protein
MPITTCPMLILGHLKEKAISWESTIFNIINEVRHIIGIMEAQIMFPSEKSPDRPNTAIPTEIAKKSQTAIIRVFLTVFVDIL